MDGGHEQKRGILILQADSRTTLGDSESAMLPRCDCCVVVVDMPRGAPRRLKGGGESGDVEGRMVEKTMKSLHHTDAGQEPQRLNRSHCAFGQRRWDEAAHKGEATAWETPLFRIPTCGEAWNRSW